MSNIETWSIAAVASWLTSIGLEPYCDEFKENCIDGACLLLANHDMLKELKMDKLGHRLKLLKAVYQLKKEQGISIESDDFIPESDNFDSIKSDKIRMMELVIEDKDRLISDLIGQINNLKSQVAYYKDIAKGKKSATDPSPVSATFNRSYGEHSPRSANLNNLQASSPNLSNRKTPSLSTLDRGSSLKNSKLQLLINSPNMSKPPLRSQKSPNSLLSNSPMDPANNEMTIRVYGNQLPDRQNESYKSFRVGPTDDCVKVIIYVLHKYKIAGDWKDFILVMANEDVCNPTDKILDLSRKYFPNDIPCYLIRHIRHVNSPSTRPLNIEPGTYMASKLSAESVATAVGIYQYVAQSRDEMDVFIGMTYSIIARDEAWCIVEKHDQRGSVPTMCLFEIQERVREMKSGFCVFEYSRKSANEVSIQRGDQFVILDRYRHWYLIRLRDQRGLVPCSHVSLMNESEMKVKVNFFLLNFQEKQISPNTQNQKSLSPGMNYMLNFFFSNSKLDKFDFSNEALTSMPSSVQLILQQLESLLVGVEPVLSAAQDWNKYDIETFPLSAEKVDVNELKEVLVSLEDSFGTWERRSGYQDPELSNISAIYNIVRRLVNYAIANHVEIHSNLLQGPLAMRIIYILTDIAKKNVSHLNETASLFSKMENTNRATGDHNRLLMELKQILVVAFRKNYFGVKAVISMVREDVQVANILKS
ncbi:hypothetical protein BC833DRAFT_583627 [Globomyces pollinis-pini]|nr:hypothetical protein BC833DRAFT_583627 [Globomyces pollinis-pini]